LRGSGAGDLQHFREPLSFDDDGAVPVEHDRVAHPDDGVSPIATGSSIVGSATREPGTS
jgi:hypothetical protein